MNDSSCTLKLKPFQIPQVLFHDVAFLASLKKTLCNSGKRNVPGYHNRLFLCHYTCNPFDCAIKAWLVLFQWQQNYVFKLHFIFNYHLKYVQLLSQFAFENDEVEDSLENNSCSNKWKAFSSFIYPGTIRVDTASGPLWGLCCLPNFQLEWLRVNGIYPPSSRSPVMPPKPEQSILAGCLSC